MRCHLMKSLTRSPVFFCVVGVATGRGGQYVSKDVEMMVISNAFGRHRFQKTSALRLLWPAAGFTLFFTRFHFSSCVQEGLALPTLH